jgi:hypothetical protein
MTSRPPWLGVGMTFGGFLASKVGPVWWRVYWVVVAILVIRFAAVLWKRLQLSRMAAGLMVGACLLGSFPLLGKTPREANAAMDSHWMWMVGIVIVVLALVAWERQRKPFGLTVLRDSRPSRFLDWLTLRHIPDLRDQRNA